MSVIRNEQKCNDEANGWPVWPSVLTYQVTVNTGFD